MKTYFLTTEKEKIYTGEPAVIKVKLPENYIASYIYSCFTEENAKPFVEKGIMTGPYNEEDAVELLIPYIEGIGLKTGLKFTEVLNMFIRLYHDFPEAVCRILLKEIAIQEDMKYKDHISKSKEIFSISFIDGQIIRIPKDKILNYKTFAAFRTVDDAKKALNILNDFISDMFHE